MKKEFTLLFSVFALTSAYSQVGIGTTDPTATLDVDGTLRFRQGLPINAIQSLPLILGTDENGNVLPNKISDGLISTATGDLQVLPNPNGGVSVDSNGVSVKAGNGILVDANGVAVNPGNGILVDADGVAINPGEGISFNTNNAIQVQPKENGGLTVDNNGVAIKSNEAISVNGDGVSVLYGEGILLDEDSNSLVLDVSYLPSGNNPTNVLLGNGLRYEDSEDSEDSEDPEDPKPIEVFAKTDSGIVVTNEGVAVIPGNGLITDTEGLKVKAYNGINVNGSGVTIKLKNPSGLTLNQDGLAVKAGKAITLDGTTLNQVSVKTGYGTMIDSNNGVAVNPGVGIMINNNNAVDVKLATNSALKLENGLKVETDQAGGLKINNNQLGIAHDSSLKTGNVNTTAAVPYSELGVNNSATRGIGVDSNGVYVKIGNGLAYTNGNLTTTITNEITEADNGLSKVGNTIKLGGELNKPTIITTSASKTLALKGLQQAGASYNNLVINSDGVIQYANPPIQSTPVPALIGLNGTLNYFLKDKSIGESQALTGLKLVFNNIGSNFSLSGSNVNIPAGVYQFNFTLAAGAVWHDGSLGCTISSYFMNFPTGNGTTSEKLYFSAIHRGDQGNATGNHGTYVTFTTILTRDISWEFALGIGGSGNCENATNLAIDGGATQLTILRMGDAPN